MHNEVDGGLSWTNMGVKPVTIFSDTYIKSMRMCYNIVRQYDEHAEVFASFSHSWTDISNVGWYTSKDIVDLLNTYSRVEEISNGLWHIIVMRNHYLILVHGLTRMQLTLWIQSI